MVTVFNTTNTFIHEYRLHTHKCMNECMHEFINNKNNNKTTTTITTTTTIIIIIIMIIIIIIIIGLMIQPTK